MRIFYKINGESESSELKTNYVWDNIINTWKKFKA